MLSAARVTALRPGRVMPAHPRRRDGAAMPTRLVGRLVLVLLIDAAALLVLSWVLPGLTIDRFGSAWPTPWCGRSCCGSRCRSPC
jgi:hypothetical protein